MNPGRTDSLRNRNTNFFTEGGNITAGTNRPPTISEEPDEGEAKSPSPTMAPEPHIVPLHSCVATIVEETFNIWLPDTQQEVLVRCDKPVKLKVLLSEVQVTIAQDNCKLEYNNRDGKLCKLQTQEQLDEYLRLPRSSRPQLHVAIQKTKAK